MEKNSRSAESRKRARQANFRRHVVAPAAAIAVFAGMGAEFVHQLDAKEQTLQVPGTNQSYREVHIGDIVKTSDGKEVTLRNLWDIASSAYGSSVDTRDVVGMLKKEIPEGETVGTLQDGDTFRLPASAHVGELVNPDELNLHSDGQ